MPSATPPPPPTPHLPSPVCNFSGIAHLSTVQNFCHFCNASKGELKEHQNMKDWLLQCKDSYNYRIELLEKDLGIASAYGIKKSFCLNESNNFHMLESLPSDIARDMFESLAVDVIISEILLVFVKEKSLAFKKISIRRPTFKQSNPEKAINQQPIKTIYGSNFKL